jgi:hypothetical protein
MKDYDIFKKSFILHNIYVKLINSLLKIINFIFIKEWNYEKNSIFGINGNNCRIFSD